MITPTQMKQKIKNIQTKTGIPAQLLQRNFIMERFLFRLSQSAYKENFILNGGYLVGQNKKKNRWFVIESRHDLRGSCFFGPGCPILRN